jgi:hypothetical protein
MTRRAPGSLAEKDRGPCVPVAVCYSRGVERSSSCAKGSSAFDKMERGQTEQRSAGGLGRLSFGFGFEQSKA